MGYAVTASGGILDARISAPIRCHRPAYALRWDGLGLAGVVPRIDIDVPNLQVLSSLTTDGAITGLVAAIRCFERFAEKRFGPRPPTATVYSDTASWWLAVGVGAAMGARLAPL